MPFRCLFYRHSVSTHRFKKTHLAFTLVLVGCLLFNLTPAARGFIAWEHQDFPNLDTLIKQDYLVFGSDLGFRSQMLRFSRNIASTARSYSGKTFTHIK